MDLTTRLPAAAVQYVVKFVPEICAFLQLVAMDPNRDGKICYNATALVGDLFQAMPQAAGQHLTRQTPWLTQLVTECMKNGDDESVEMAKWAASVCSVWCGAERADSGADTRVPCPGSSYLRSRQACSVVFLPLPRRSGQHFVSA